MHITYANMEPTREKRLQSKKVEDIDFSFIPHGKETPIRVHHHSYDPRPCEMQKTTKNKLEEFTEQLKALQVPCGFCIYSPIQVKKHQRFILCH